MEETFNESEESAVEIKTTDAINGVDKCPSCGGSTTIYDAATEKLSCTYCRHVWVPTNFETANGFDSPIGDLQGIVMGAGAQNIDVDASELVTLKCGGCGAEVIIDTTKNLQARCHWCRHRLSLNAQIPNGAVPDAILPFRLTREEAIQKIEEFAGKRKTFAHKKFKAQFEPHNIMGVYLPYMIIDGNVHGEVRGFGEIQTRSYKKKVNNREVQYYDADVYEIGRKFDFHVDDLHTESSSDRSNMDASLNTNNVLNAVLPFDVKNALAFNANYMGEHTSEKRTLDVDALLPRVTEKFLSIARSEATKVTGKYTRGVRWEKEHVDIKGSRWLSIYVPVWLYSYYEDRGANKQPFVHYIAVNARNGKTMGSIPINKSFLFSVSTLIGLIVTALAVPLALASGTVMEDDNVNVEPSISWGETLNDYELDRFEREEGRF